MKNVQQNAWIDFRMGLAYWLLGKCLDMMDAKHPHTLILAIAISHMKPTKDTYE